MSKQWEGLNPVDFRNRKPPIPSRLFLDTSVLQVLEKYGEFVYENVHVPESDRIYDIPSGIQNLDALRMMMIMGRRDAFELIVTHNTYLEVDQKGDSGFLNWFYEVADYTQSCLNRNGALSGAGQKLCDKLDKEMFDYLGKGDRILLKDAIILECDAFITLDAKLVRNKKHLEREIGILVTTPDKLWEILKPWAALWI